MSSFQRAIEDVLRQSAQPGSQPTETPAAPQPQAMSFADAIDSIVQQQIAEAPGAVPGSAPGEADIMQGAAQAYEGLAPQPGGMLWSVEQATGIPLTEVQRGLTTGVEQAAMTIALPGMRGQFIRSLMRPVELIAGLFSDEEDAAMRDFVNQAVANRLSMALEPEDSGLSTADLRSELITMRGAAQGMAKGQQEGMVADVARALGQNLPQTVGTIGALATGNIPAAASIAAMGLMPFTAYSSGFLENMEETDQQRALDALEGRPLTEFDPSKARTRAEAQATIETAVELGGASLGAKAIGRLAGLGVKTKVGQAALRPFAERGAPLVAKAIASKPGQQAVETFNRLSNGTASFRNGWLGRASGIMAVSGAEESGEEVVTAALMAPFTAAPLSEDLANGLYGGFIGAIAGGVGGGTSVLAVTGNRALMNRREAMRPETDQQRALRVAHSEAMKARTNWTADLDSAQTSRVAAALDSVNGMTQEQRGVYLADLSRRRAETQERAETLLDERQKLDVALMGAMADPAGADAATQIRDRIAQIDTELSLAVTDRMTANAVHNAVAEKISEMPAVMEQGTPEQVLSDAGTRAGVTLEQASMPKAGKKVQEQVEALGRRVVWFRTTDGKFNPGFHSMRTQGVVYLNANAPSSRWLPTALEEVFHDIQMFQPELAGVFMEKAGLEPIYAMGVDYAARGRAEGPAQQRMDVAALEQAAAAVQQVEGATAALAPETRRAGAARLEQEGTANAFAAAAAAAKSGSILAPLVEFAARRGFLGRETMAAMQVFDAVQRAAAIENVAGPKQADATLSPLARTLLWANDMDVNFARDQKEAATYVTQQIKARSAEREKLTKAEKALATRRESKVGDIQKIEALGRLRQALVGTQNMREGERLAMARRFLQAASAMSTLSFRTLTPVEYLAGHRRNKATQTLTQYTLDQIANPQVEQVNGRDARITFEPYGIPGLDVAYMIKRVEYLDDKGEVSGERFDEAVGLYSNEGDITDVIQPVMLHAISRYPDTPMMCDCYDVCRPEQLATNGKLPSAYKQYGFVADTSQVPDGYSAWNPAYLSPPAGMTLDEYVALLEKYWTAEGWVAEKGPNGQVTNYPGVWFAKLNLTADERRRVQQSGIAGFAADPERLASIAAGGTAGGVEVGVAFTPEGRPVQSLARSDERAGVGDGQGNSAGRESDPDIFIGRSRRISLAKLTLALKAELDSMSPDQKGRLLSASQWLPTAVTVTPERLAQEKQAATDAIVAATRAVAAAEKRVDEINDEIKRERARLKKEGSASSLLRYAQLGRSSELASLASIANSMSDQQRSLIALATERQEQTQRRKDITGAVEAAREAKTDPDALVEQAKAVGARLREIEKELSEWRAQDPLVQSLLDAKIEVDAAQQKLADTKQSTFGDILADRGILSYRLAGERKYTVPELQGLLDSFAQSIVGWLNEYTSANKMPDDVRQVAVRAIADDLKYAATKVGSASALEWYGRIVDQMWQESAEKYPELANTSSDDRRVFAMFLAITSQGEKVSQNAILTRSLYETWVKNGRGRIVIPAGFDARLVEAMIKNLNKLNALYDAKGSWQAVEKFMLKKALVKEHNASLRKQVLNGKSASDVIGLIDDAAESAVYMSSVLGPKIGSFYNNLHKKFDTLTADVWFTRTFMRMLGALRRPDETGVRSAIADIARELARARAAVANGPNDPGYVDAQGILAIVPQDALSNPEALQKAAMDFNAEFPRNKANRLASGKLRKKTPAEAALVRYAKAATASAAAPETLYARGLMRDVMTEAIALVKQETGIEYEMADAQAALWYVEKELYARFGAAPDPAGQDYRQAMRDAMAVDISSADGARKIAEALAEVGAGATAEEAADAGVIAASATESFARDEEIEREQAATVEAIRGLGRWARTTGFDLSFSRPIDPEILARVERREVSFLGAGPETPFVLYHNSNDQPFEPYKVRGKAERYYRGLSLSNQSQNLKQFGNYQYSFYAIAERPLTIKCHGSPWDRIVLPKDTPIDVAMALQAGPDAADEAAIAEELEVAGIMASTDSIARAAIRSGYDAVIFENVEEPESNESGFTHDEIVVSSRKNLISVATGKTLHDMDMSLWREDPTAAPPASVLGVVENLGGSTGAQKARDPNGGTWVIKRGANPRHVINEFEYLRAMRELNVNVPSADMDLVPEAINSTNVIPTLITKFADGYVPLLQYVLQTERLDGFAATPVFAQIQQDFVAHVLARNWDMIGLEMDNALVDPDTDTLIWVDLGGSGEFRAQGRSKEDVAKGEWDAPFLRDIRTMWMHNSRVIDKPDPRAVAEKLLQYALGIGSNEDVLKSLPALLTRNLFNTISAVAGYQGQNPLALADDIATNASSPEARERLLQVMARRIERAIDGLPNVTSMDINRQLLDATTQQQVLSLLPDEPLHWNTDPETYRQATQRLQDAVADPKHPIYNALNSLVRPIGGADGSAIYGVMTRLMEMRSLAARAPQIPQTEVEPEILPQGAVTGAFIPYGSISMARDPDADAEEIASLQAQVTDLQRQMRDVQNVTAAQRANAAREVRLLERRISALSLLSEQRLGQANRAKAKAERMLAINEADRAEASETVERMRDKVEETKARIARLREDAKAQRAATKEAMETLAEAEDKADRVANWAYAIGRNEGLVAGQVAGMQAERRANRPYRERLALVEARLAQATANLKEANARIKTDAKAAPRAINLAHQIGLRSGIVQGMMRGRQQILRKMQQREDTLQRQLQSLRDLMDLKVTNLKAMDNAVRSIAFDAASMLPVRLRGPLATRIANAKTLSQANRVAVEATKLAVNEEVRQQLRVIAALRKRMNKRGMRWDVRQQIENLISQADTALRQSNRRRVYAKVATMTDASGRRMGAAVVNAVGIYAQVVAAANDVQTALMLYEQDRQTYEAAQAARVARYNDLKDRMLRAMAGRPTLSRRERSDQPPVQSLARRISLANSDIYTLMLEVEGTMSGVLNEMLVAAQDAKGAAALEHARILRDLSTALAGAGYNGLEDYALRNGLQGTAGTETITVTMEGQPRTIPVGVAMSIAAMDDETLELFVPPAAPDAARQGLQFAGAETTLTVYPTDAEIRAIRAALTPGQRNLIDTMKSVLETQVRDRAMEAVFLVEGDQPPVVPNYWPRVRNSDEFQGENKSVLAAHGTLVRSALTSVGFTNAREGGRLPLIYRDAFQTWERHLQVALDMIHMAQSYRDAATVLTDPRIAQAIDMQMGRDTATALLSFFSNGVGATARGSTNAIDRLTNNVTGAVLSLSPRTAAKVVVGGTIRLASELPGEYWVKGVTIAGATLRSPSGWQARVDEIHAYSGYFTRRHQMQMRGIISGTMSAGDRVKVMTAARGFARAIGAAGHSLAAKNITDALNAMGDATDNANLTLTALVDLLRLMDEQIMLVAVEGRLQQVRDEGLTGDAALREAVKRAERDFRLTQNASDEFDETAFAAVNRTRGSGATWRLVFPFSSDPLKARNQMRRAWLTGQRRIGTAFAIAGNTASGTIIGAASTLTVAYVAKAIASLLGGADEPDDEEDKAFKDAVKNVPVQVAGEVVGSSFGYVGLAFSTALQSIVTRRAMGQALVARPVEQAAREAQSDGNAALNATSAMLALLQLRGVPLYQLVRFIEAQVPEGKSSPEEKQREQIDRLRERYSPEAIRERALNNARRKAAGQIRLP